MFETDIDGEGIGCDHPIRWYQRVFAFIHQVFEQYLPLSHHLMTDAMCDAYERVYFDFPCGKCEEDRTREFGVVNEEDAGVIERLRRKNPFRRADDTV